MIIRMDPMYGIFDKDSVLGLIEEVAGVSRYETRVLVELLRIYYDAEGSSSARMDDYVSALPKPKLAKSVHYWKTASLATSAAGHEIRITDKVLRENTNALRYAAFPQKLYDIIYYYKDVTCDEILYIVNFAKEAGFTEQEMLNSVAAAYATDDSITLSDLTDFATNHKDVDANADYERNYHTALELQKRFNNDEKTFIKEGIRFAGQWHEMGFTKGDILLASSKAIESPTLRYLNAILINARKAMDKTGIKKYKELEDITDKYRDITGAAGKDQLTPENIALFATLNSKYDSEIIRLAAKAAERERERKISKQPEIVIIKRILEKWESMNVCSVDEAAEYLKAQEATEALMSSIERRIGLHMGEYERGAFKRSLRQWKKEGYSDNQILIAAEAAMEAEHPVRYMSTVLKNINNDLPM